jgi:hypothetical protein
MSALKELARLLASDDEFTQQKLSDDTGVILDVDSLKVFSLNESGQYLVDCLRQGVTSEEELVDRLVEEFDVAEETARKDVAAFVTMLEAHLIDNRKTRS